MKTKRLLFFVAFILGMQIANGQDFAILQGSILHAVSDTILVRYSSSNIAYLPVYYGSAISAKWDFNIKVPLINSSYTQAELCYANTVTDIMLHAGDSIILKADSKSYDSSMIFKGRGAAVNNFLLKHFHERGRINQYSLKIRNYMNAEPDSFLAGIDKELQTEMKFLDENGKNIPSSFRQYWRAYYRYFNYYFITEYPEVHEMAKKRRFTDTIARQSYTVLKNMPLDFHDSLMDVAPYLLYLTRAIESKLRADGYFYYLADTLKMKEVQDSVLKLSRQLMPAKSAAYFYAQFIYGKIRYRSLETTRKQLNEFCRLYPQSQDITVMKNELEIASRLAPGQTAPPLAITGNDGNPVRLSDYLGKVVYINFWSTSCRSCFADMVSEEKITGLLKDKPYVFLHISLDNDTTSINRMVKRYKLSGVFGFLQQGWDSPEAIAYGVQALPAYYLVDEKGRFALQNTPNPNQYTELLVEIEKLFE